MVEIRTGQLPLTQRQRWGFYLTLAFSAVGFMIGIGLRDSTLYAKAPYVSVEAGIQASYPQNWLIDTAGDYVFRVRDISRLGFKTTIQVALLPVSVETETARSVLDSLNLNRSQVLADYSVQSIEPYLLPDETPALKMGFTFVAFDIDPFLESGPVVVQGVDVLASRRGQAVVVTFMTDVSTFDEDFGVFEQFLRDLRF